MGRSFRRRQHAGPPSHGLSCVQSIEIDAPLETVWEIVTNVSNYPVILRDTTCIQPLGSTRNGNNNCAVVGAKYRQYVTHPRWRTKHELDFTITHVGSTATTNNNDDDDDVDDTSCRSFKGATRVRGHDFTATQTVERRLDKCRCLYIVTYASIPYNWWGRILASCLFRYPLLAEANYSAHNTCVDIKAAAEKMYNTLQGNKPGVALLNNDDPTSRASVTEQKDDIADEDEDNFDDSNHDYQC